MWELKPKQGVIWNWDFNTYFDYSIQSQSRLLGPITVQFPHLNKCKTVTTVIKAAISGILCAVAF